MPLDRIDEALVYDNLSCCLDTQRLIANVEPPASASYEGHFIPASG
jgi:hypothetical protein